MLREPLKSPAAKAPNRSATHDSQTPFFTRDKTPEEPFFMNKPALVTNANTMVQRVKVLVGNKLVHINDYHFLNRMHLVEQIGVSKSTHGVLLNDFSDFDGLAEAAEVKNTKKFDYAGYTWEWLGENELIPKEGPNIAMFSGEQISALVQYIHNNTSPNNEFQKNDEFKKAFNRIEKMGLAKPEASESAEKLNLTFNVKKLPFHVRYDTGKPGQGFLWGPNGSKEEFPHLHIFGNRNDESFTIQSAHATLRPTHQSNNEKRHWSIDANFKVVKNEKEGSIAEDNAVIAELEAILYMLKTRSIVQEEKEEKIEIPQNEQELEPYCQYAELPLNIFLEIMKEVEFSVEDVMGMKPNEFYDIFAEQIRTKKEKLQAETPPEKTEEKEEIKEKQNRKGRGKKKI